MNKHFLVIINPVPSRARARVLDKFIRYLKHQSLSYEIYPTEACQSANRHYFDNHLSKFSDLIVVGGDGTFHNVINSLSENSKQPIGLIPAGTGNDFARWLYRDQRTNLPFIFKQVVGKWIQQISLGVCEFPDGKRTLFHNVLGLGFDALLAKELKDSKGLFRSLGYFTKALQHVPFYSALDMELQLGEENRKYKNLITAFANAEYFGAGLNIAPGADAAESSLKMCRVEQLSRLKVLGQIGRLFNGSHVKQDFVDYRELESEAKVITAGLDIEADGEYLGQSPCVIKVKPAALKVKRL